jgi:DNA-binding HxlR family transcriptional regulator
MIKSSDLASLVNDYYALEILGSLSESPKRFVDLDAICKNERTRTQKLRILEEFKLVETKPVKVKKKAFLYYHLTERGKKFLKEVNKFKERLNKL